MRPELLLWVQIAFRNSMHFVPFQLTGAVSFKLSLLILWLG